ncbi:hypothetical protein MHBO_001525 [Bonamia ostreae]|uniref:Uncharacterized protein n=1 Tax=Bonamia ostreae TaxID=126728 RepID=A0ABV2AJ89_9EUKA
MLMIPTDVCSIYLNSYFFGSCVFKVNLPARFVNQNTLVGQTTWICSQDGNLTQKFNLTVGCNDDFVAKNSMELGDGCTDLEPYIFGHCDMCAQNIKFRKSKGSSELANSFKYACNDGNDNSGDIYPVKGCREYTTPIFTQNALQISDDCITDSDYFFMKCMFIDMPGFMSKVGERDYIPFFPSECTEEGRPIPPNAGTVWKGCLRPSVNLPGILEYVDCNFFDNWYYGECSTRTSKNYVITKNNKLSKMLKITCPRTGVPTDENISILPWCVFPSFASHVGALIADECRVLDNGFAQACKVVPKDHYRFLFRDKVVDSVMLDCDENYDPDNYSVDVQESCLKPKQTSQDALNYSKCSEDGDERFFADCTVQAIAGYFIEIENRFSYSQRLQCGQQGASLTGAQLRDLNRVPDMIFVFRITHRCNLHSIDDGEIVSGCIMNGPCMYRCDVLYVSHSNERGGETFCLHEGFLVPPQCVKSAMYYVLVIGVPFLVVVLSIGASVWYMHWKRIWFFSETATEKIFTEDNKMVSLKSNTFEILEIN